MTTGSGTTGSGEQGALAAGERAGDAWQAIRADPAIQYAPVTLPKEPETPGWLVRFMEFLGDLFAPVARFIAGNWGAIWPVLAVGAGLLLLYFLYTILAPVLVRGGQDGGDVEGQWRPEEGAARLLLEDADRLAADGRYDEAVHLLLLRSIGQISAIRPDLVEPSSTAREIAGLHALPEAARSAFAAVSARVEQSLFALRRLSAEDWQVARGAYAEFALSADRGLAA